MRDLDNKLNQFHQEVQAAYEDAQARLGGARRVKLGDLNLRDEFYRDVKPLLRQIYNNSSLRRKYFEPYDATQSRQSRHLLLVFMSELVYWEYEKSFWQMLYDAFGLRDQTDQNSAYRWLTTQMERGYEENGIDLIRSRRREFVQTIVNESGFSRQLVQEAKKFVLWFFEHHTSLDPRTLDSESFRQIVKDYRKYAWEEDTFALLRDMVGSVNRLLREIRKNSLTSSDLQNAEILKELETALGFHPIRGIFGFRKEEDIQELLEKLSLRMKPNAFQNMLYLKIRSSGGRLEVVTPRGKRIEAKQVQDVPLMFGNYRLEWAGSQGHQNEIQVVPREALTLDKLNSLLWQGKRRFHEARDNYVFIHDDRPFEIYQGSAEAEKPFPYHLPSLIGYLWYGKRKIGIPLRAEREGRLISELTPRLDVWLNPRLRLNGEGDGLLVVIPSFVCFKPDLAGQTVRLELNGRKIEYSTLPIPLNGLLQFQGTRVGKVEPDDTALKVRLVTLKKKQTVESQTVRASLVEPLLFSKNNGELVSPGTRTHGWDQFVLFVPDGSSIKLGKAIDAESEYSFGPFRLLHLRWKNKKQPFNLKAGDKSWQFERPYEIYATIFCPPSQKRFHPQEANSAFSPDEVQIRLHTQGTPQQLSQIREKLTLIIDKDGEFLTDFSLKELERRGMSRYEATQQSRQLDLPAIIRYLIDQRLTDREVGSYRYTLMVRSHALADLESLSELDFMLLPPLQAHNLEQVMIEGQAASVTVQCESPYLADEEDHGTTERLLTCTPEAHIEAETLRLTANTLSETVRLLYPPTKVSLTFKPNLFAMRLVNQGRVLPDTQLTYQEAQTAELLLLMPLGESVSLSLLGREETLTCEAAERSDANGHIRYPLSNLLPLIKDKQSTITVAWREIRQEIKLVWYPSLKLRPEECRIEHREEGKGVIILRLEANGPPNTKTSFKVRYPIPLFPPRIEPHSFTFSELDSGEIELPVDLETLKKGQLLRCSSWIECQSFGTVELPLDQALSPQVIEVPKAAMIEVSFHHSSFKAEIERKELDIQANGQSVTLHAFSPHAAFSPQDVKISLQTASPVEQLLDIWDQLTLRVEKEGQFLSDFPFSTLSQKKFLSNAPASGAILFDVPSILNELLAQGLTEPQIGSHRWRIIFIADASKSLSELDFMLLPHFRVSDLETPIIEGQKGSLTLSCDTQSLADAQNKPTNQFHLVYGAEIEQKSGRLYAKVIEKTIPLLYPRTKACPEARGVSLSFQPQLFAMRLFSGGRTFSRQILTYAEAQSISLLLLTPPEDSIRISMTSRVSTSLGTEERLTSDANGCISYPLASLLPKIEERYTTLAVAWREIQQEIKIVWYPTLKIRAEECRIERRSEEKEVLLLALEADGPPNTKVSFHLFDNRLHSHGEQTFTLQVLREGSLGLPVEIERLKNVQILYCRAFIEAQPVSTLKILLAQTVPQVTEVELAQELADIFEQANPKAQLALLEALEKLAQPTLFANVPQTLYSPQSLARLADDYQRQKMDEKQITAYFKHLTPALLSNMDQFSIPALKKCLRIPFPPLQLKCAATLLRQNDGIGIEKIIEFMKNGQMPWDDGLEVLSLNIECVANTIRDLVKWSSLERENDQYIDLIIKLCHQFAPDILLQAQAVKDWKGALNLKQKRELIECKVKGWYRYGLTVSIGPINGQVPLEELILPRHGLRDHAAKSRYLAKRVHQTIEVIVVEVDSDHNRLVLSEKQAKEQRARELLQELQRGDRRAGVVTGIRDFGVFVDLGGIDGLIRAKELSSDEKKLYQSLTRGDKVAVYVQDINRARNQVTLKLIRVHTEEFSHHALGVQKAKTFQIGQKVRGRVTRLEPYGAFVSLREEMDGFIPTGELSNTTIKHPKEVVELGHILDLRVLRVDHEKQSIILSLKQVDEQELYWGNIRIKAG